MAPSRRAALLLGGVAIALIALYCVAWAAVSPAQEGTSDFSAFYVGGTLLRTGHLADLYSAASQAAVHATLVPGGVPGNLAFVYPPPTAFLMAPVSLLPFQVAYRVWQAVELLCLAGAVLLARRAVSWGDRARAAGVPAAAALAAFAGTGTIAVGLLGQWDGGSALGLAAAYALWRRNHLAAGGAVLAASTVFKPQLALGLAALLLGWRDRRVLLGALTTVAGLALASLVTVGPAGLAGMVQAIVADGSHWPLASMLGFTGLLGSWLGDGATTEALAAVLTAASCAACVVLGTRLRTPRATGRPDPRPHANLELCLAAATTLSLLASPHLLSQDLALLPPMLVVTLGWASRGATRGQAWPDVTSRWVLGGWVLLCVAAAIDLGSQAPAPPGRLVPLVLIVLGAALARRVLVRRPGPVTVAA